MVQRPTGILAAIALGIAVTACTPPEHGVVLAYTYNLTVENHSGEARIVVPTNDGGVGPYSVAYLPPPDGQRWATGGATLGDNRDAQILVYNAGCHLVAQVAVPQRTSDSDPTTLYLLTLTDSGAALLTSPSGTGQTTSAGAPGSDIVDLCPRTDPPMWGI
jgi:hypothetical protein